MATHLGILAWKIPRTGEPGPWGRKKLAFFKKNFIYLFILAALGLRCGTQGFPGGSDSKEFFCNEGDPGCNEDFDP